MKKIALTAIALAVAGMAPAQQTITETETTVRSSPGSERVTETNTETRIDANGKTTIETTKYQERLRSAYRSAGVADAEINRLVDIDMKAREALVAGDKVKVKQYYQEQTNILQPQQVEKVRVYLKENPYAAPAPAAPAPRVYSTYEYVPTMAGVKLDTPLGSVGVGVPTGGQTVETRTVVP